VVSWVDQARKDVLLQVFTADGRAELEQPSNVSRSPEVFSWMPRVVVATSDPAHVFVLWQEIVFSGGSHGGEIFFARSADGGRSFGPPQNLSNSVAGAGKGRINREVWHNGSHDLIQAPDGTLYAAWTEYEGGLWFSRSADRGARFSPPQRVAGSDARPARGPSLAAGADGVVYLAWTVGEDQAADIRVARSGDQGGRFGEPVLASPNPGYADAPKLAVSARGTLHLVYAVAASGPFGPAQVYHARSQDGAATFQSPRRLSDPLPGGVAGAGFPALDVDAGGGVYVIWELFPSRSRSPRGLGYSFSPDDGEHFSRPARVPGSVDPAGINGSLQGLLMKKLAASRDGGVVIVNSSFREGEASRVWLTRGR
jgi:hypothetical protein